MNHPIDLYKVACAERNRTRVKIWHRNGVDNVGYLFYFFGIFASNDERFLFKTQWGDKIWYYREGSFFYQGQHDLDIVSIEKLDQ